MPAGHIWGSTQLAVLPWLCGHFCALVAGRVSLKETDPILWVACFLWWRARSVLSGCRLVSHLSGHQVRFAPFVKQNKTISKSIQATSRCFASSHIADVFVFSTWSVWKERDFLRTENLMASVGDAIFFLVHLVWKYVLVFFESKLVETVVICFVQDKKTFLFSYIQSPHNAATRLFVPKEQKLKGRHEDEWTTFVKELN